MTTIQRQTIEVPGAKLEIIKRRYTSHRSNEYGKAPRMYVSVSDESIIDNLANRRRRPYNVYKTLIHSSGIGRVLNLGSPLRWSQHAGCSCPCSPGFILPAQTFITDSGEMWPFFDVWATLENAPAIDPRKAPRVLAGAL